MLEHFSVPVKRSYRMNSSRLSTKFYETVQKLSNALYNVQKSGSTVDGRAAGASIMKKRRCAEGSGKYLVRHEMCFSLQEVLEKS